MSDDAAVALRQLVDDLRTDLQDTQEDLGDSEVRLSDRLQAATERLERLINAVRSDLQYLEDRVYRLERK